MSEILSCVEQREEQTELEEAGGAEVSWLKRALSALISPPVWMCNFETPIFYRQVSQIPLCETFAVALLWAVGAS